MACLADGHIITPNKYLTFTKYLMSIILHPSSFVGGTDGTYVALLIFTELFPFILVLPANKLNDCFFSWYLGVPEDQILSEYPV